MSQSNSSHCTCWPFTHPVKPFATSCIEQTATNCERSDWFPDKDVLVSLSESSHVDQFCFWAADSWRFQKTTYCISENFIKCWNLNHACSSLTLSNQRWQQTSAVLKYSERFSNAAPKKCGIHRVNSWDLTYCLFCKTALFFYSAAI